MAKKKVIEMSVAEYMADYVRKNPSETITKNKVYKWIKEEKIKAHKNEKGAWIIEIPEPAPVKEYSVKDFVEEYNEKHIDAIITIKKVRELAAKGMINAKKLCGKWVIFESPKRKIRK